MNFNKKIAFLFLLAGLLLFLDSTTLLAQYDTVYVNGEMYVKKKPKVKIDKRKFRTLFEQANLMLIENFNDTALRTFLVLHAMDPTNANVNFKIGQLYLNSSSEKSRAVDYLELAVPKATRNYVPDDPMEKKCPELVYYLLGQAYHLTYRFDEALEMFSKFKKCVNMAELSLAKEIQRREEICKTAQALSASPIKCTITNLGDSVNTPTPDYGAIITADESQIFFTSRRLNPETGGNDNRTVDDKYYEDIWVSDKNPKGQWGEAHPLSTHVNSWYNEAVVGLSADGQQLFYYKDDKGGSIYYSKLEGDQWSYGYMLGTDPGDITDINSPAWEPSACIAPDGSTLYFVSNRPGGFGGRDIYKCVKLPTGKWSKATNLGPTINTIYDEDAPFMHPDGVTLFFSSNGHKTMGGFDIFFCMLFEEGWSPPQNMGYPINTTDDDIFYVMSTDGKRAYFSSVRAEGYGEKDLYMVTLPQRIVIPVTLMKGYVSFAGRKDSMTAFVTISATDLESGNVVQEVHPNTRTMKYILPLNPGRSGKTYLVKYEAEGFRPYTETISVSPEGEYKEVDRDYDFRNLGGISCSGKVKTRTGEPVQGAKITVKDNLSKKQIGVYTPAADGTYFLELPGRGGESYSLTFEAPTLLPITQTIELPASPTEFDFKRDATMESFKMQGTISISGTLMDMAKHPLTEGTITVTNNVKGEVIGTFTPDSKGAYYFNLQRGGDYNISYEAEGHLFQSENINVPKDKTFSEITKDIRLEKIKKGAKVALNNIFFESGKATLRKESNVELDKVLKFLSDQPAVKVEIGGHSDNAGLAETNMQLSQDRADAVVEYLINKGINRDRLSSQGYGDTQPIAPNTVNGKPNLRGMQMNRRVEFQILNN